MAEEIERISKKTGRHYKRPSRPIPAINDLMPKAIQVLNAVLANVGDGPSVTTILGILAKPALIGWAAKQERKMIAKLASQLYKQSYQLLDEPMSPEKFEELIMEQAGKGAHRRLLEEAANVGTQVHARIEWELKGELAMERGEEPLLTSLQAKRSFVRWTEWRASAKLKPIKLETRLFSTVFGFGGTADLLAEITIDDVVMVVLIDWKTGKHVYEEAFLQNVAYRMALREEGVKVDRGIIVRVPKYEDDPEFDAVDVPDDPELETAFLALKVVFHWWDKVENQRKDRKKETKG